MLRAKKPCEPENWSRAETFEKRSLIFTWLLIFTRLQISPGNRTKYPEWQARVRIGIASGQASSILRHSDTLFCVPRNSTKGKDTACIFVARPSSPGTMSNPPTFMRMGQVLDNKADRAVQKPRDVRSRKLMFGSGQLDRKTTAETGIRQLV